MATGAGSATRAYFHDATFAFIPAPVLENIEVVVTDQDTTEVTITESGVIVIVTETPAIEVVVTVTGQVSILITNQEPTELTVTETPAIVVLVDVQGAP